MFIYNIIDKKRKKEKLTSEEIYYVVNAFVKKEITEAQMSSLLMAICINGMDFDETFSLTLAMRDSSEVLKFKEFLIDKHSTGGVSDSTTLIIVPLLASLGLKLAKMSGRSLGFTGGTIDKLEVFEGYDAEKSLKEFVEIINKHNCSIISQTSNLAYADKLIYKLRDQTATVESIPLIASSVMSKKLASGAKFLLLNVHFGVGAFMKTKKEAIKLAEIMVKIGKKAGIETKAVISNMNSPLASGVGCVEEVKSVIDALNGEDSNLLKLSKKIATIILSSVNKISEKEAEKLITENLKNGLAKTKLKELIVAHGGNSEFVDYYLLIKKPKFTLKVLSNENGYLNNIDAFVLANTTMQLKNLNTNVETKKLVGIKVLKKINDKIQKGDVLAEVYVNSKSKLDDVLKYLQTGLIVSKKKAKQEKLIEKVIY